MELSKNLFFKNLEVKFYNRNHLKDITDVFFYYEFKNQKDLIDLF